MNHQDLLRIPIWSCCSPFRKEVSKNVRNGVKYPLTRANFQLSRVAPQHVDTLLGSILNLEGVVAPSNPVKLSTTALTMAIAHTRSTRLQRLGVCSISTFKYGK